MTGDDKDDGDDDDRVDAADDYEDIVHEDNDGSDSHEDFDRHVVNTARNDSHSDSHHRYH